MGLSPRNRLIIVGAVAALAVVVLIAVLILPTIRSLGSLREQIESAEATSDSARLLLEQRQQVKAQAAATNAGLIELSVAVPENPDLPSLIVDLQDQAYESGVVLRSVTPAAPIEAEGVPHVELPISLEVRGPWSDTVDFLQQLRRTPRQLRITKVTVGGLAEPSPEELPTTGLTYPPYYQLASTIELRAYVIPAGAAAPPPAAAPPAETPEP
jgi:type IV pilus assembly protein PilO